MLKVLVLGCNSFAGSQFVDFALTQGCDVIGVNRSCEQSPIFLPYKQNPHKGNYQFFQYDINHNFKELIELLKSKRPTFIVDFAGQGMVAESWSAPEQWFTTNLVAKSRLYSFLNQVNWLDKYLRVSTPEVYGSQNSLSPESTNYHPSTPYAVSHAAVDMNLHAYFDAFQFPVILTRFSNFYGPGQQLYRIIPRAIIYGLIGKKLLLHGGGNAVRAFIHGQDVAAGIWASLTRGKIGEIYHFSTSDFVSIKELVQLIHKKLAIDFNQNVEITADRIGKDTNYLMDDTKAQQQLGWQSQISLPQGIEQTINWVKSNLEEIRLLPFNYQHKE